MTIKEVSSEVIVATTLQELGVKDVSSDITSCEALTASARRAASFLCPCSRTKLISEISDSLRHLIYPDFEIEREIADIVEAMIAYGDLLEVEDVISDNEDIRGTWVFAAPPAFVSLNSGRILLLGVAKDHNSALPPHLESRIEISRFSRSIQPESEEDLASILMDLGLIKRSESSWMGSPKIEKPTEHLESMDRHLASAERAGDLPDIQILDPNSSVKYYRGRWTASKSKHHGNYVARRPQAYGSALWGYVALEQGHPVRFLDLLDSKSKWRGCDFGWRLQLSIDFCAGHPQVFRRRVNPMTDGIIFDFFSPLPMWARRRWETIGRYVEREKCLFSVWLPNENLDQEIQFMESELWVAEIDSG